MSAVAAPAVVGALAREFCCEVVVRHRLRAQAVNVDGERWLSLYDFCESLQRDMEPLDGRIVERLEQVGEFG